MALVCVFFGVPSAGAERGGDCESWEIAFGKSGGFGRRLVGRVGGLYPEDGVPAGLRTEAGTFSQTEKALLCWMLARLLCTATVGTYMACGGLASWMRLVKSASLWLKVEMHSLYALKRV